METNKTNPRKIRMKKNIQENSFAIVSCLLCLSVVFLFVFFIQFRIYCTLSNCKSDLDVPSVLQMVSKMQVEHFTLEL